ncbi:Hpt domain-containing protein [Candidatus Acetatifactor stercoripullorum]|uniref:Hpt domain-containing protein n=1 Tax=Candidatus Acetatifactor stercoripullorum TaxID=2838414 RepID=UPI00298EC224|nr:Hpt domain-containing protein [Candidatus Acetatifactor stercoripullorum]
MTVKECYALFEGDYEGVLGRLLDEARIRRFLFKFLEDENFSALMTAMRDQDVKAAFLAAHTLKGLCANLGFTRLQGAADALTEELRAGEWKDFSALQQQMEQAYEEVASALNRFREEGESS